jgi:DNA (cytosine-5)-methyltransferase 1
MSELTFGSVCSGIEAASVAWEPLGFWAEWFSEIESFPSAVLAHHWPDVPNLGDMLALPGLVSAGKIAAPDVLVGGTPCQAFSVAGNRESLADARGGLTLAYVELADAIDRQRARDGQDPCIIVWENVPGVLSTKDNAFGCFLAGLAGEDVPLLPPGKRWTNAGLVLGPKRAVAWRILDAQYFGLAQRRRRVFVVASARDGFDPSAVLLEFDGVRRDSAPRREAGQDAAADAGRRASSTGSHWGAVTNPHPSLNQSHNTGGIGASNQEVFSQRGSGLTWPARIASTLNAAFGSKQGLEDQHINQGAPLFVPSAIPILEPGARTGKSTTDMRAGMGVGDDGDPMFTLQAGKQHGVACVSVTGDIAHTLNTANNGKGCSEDGTGRGVPTIAHTVALRGREGGATAELGGEVAAALRASSGGGDKPHVLAFQERGRADGRALETNGDLACALTAPNGGGRAQERNVLAPYMAVRRLVPEECEKLQGFSPRHTLIPVKIKRKLDADELARLRALSHEALAGLFGVDPESFVGCTDAELQRLAADGPRYKAIGNSMAVPVMRWIGQRIIRHLNGEI